MDKLIESGERGDELSAGELKDIQEKVSENNTRDTYLHEHGTKNEEAVRRYVKASKDVRQNPFESDIRRIIFEKAFLRYSGKTQVVTMSGNPHVINRMDHCMRVGTESRSVARSLGYNQDLAEAIGLGHDLGHAPLGHLGEKYISMATIRHSILHDRQEIFNALGPFMHSVQSMMTAEWVMQQDGSRDAGLNLNLQTIHGFGSHDGDGSTTGSKWEKIPPDKIKEDIARHYSEIIEESSKVKFTGDPNKEEDVEAHLKAVEKQLKEKKVNLTPATPEASIVRIMDTLVYLAHDVNDYIHMCAGADKDINPHFPVLVADELGVTGRQILKSAISDLVMHSYNKDRITYSEKKGEAIKQLKKFLYRNFYDPQNDEVFAREGTRPYERMVSLFDGCTEAMVRNQDTSKKSSLVEVPHLNSYVDSRDRDMADYYQKMWHIQDSGLKIHQLVRDFIAGCTDAYFYELTDKSKT